MLEGNKTKIGFAIVAAGEVISQVNPSVGVVVLVAGYLIGGVGLADAVRRAVKKEG
jgi:hypothetical protein